MGRRCSWRRAAAAGNALANGDADALGHAEPDSHAVGDAQWLWYAISNPQQFGNADALGYRHALANGRKFLRVQRGRFSSLKFSARS